MYRKLICLLLFTHALFIASGLDFGLKFQSHNFPSDQRTTLSAGDTRFKFDKEFKLGFNFSFYSPSMFGNIVTLTTNDGQCISMVSSRLDDGTFYPGLVVNDSLYNLKQPLTLASDRPEHADITLDKTKNAVILSFNDFEMEQPVDLSKVDEVSFFFGMGQENLQAVVAPFELRNIRIFLDNRNSNFWDLKFHDTDSTNIDNLGGVEVTVKNPHWLIDEHVDWREVYSDRIAERVQTAFDPNTERFYIVTDDNITVFSPLSGDKASAKVKSGKRVLSYSNHLVFDTVTNRLINYNLNRRLSSAFDFTTGSWKGGESMADSEDEANYSNHTVALDGDKLYAFGGYGFYKYHNSFFIVDLSTGEVREQHLTPELMPMTSSAAAVVDSTLYIFGGKGNPSGRQELPVRHSYSLYAFDTSTWKGRKVWELDSVANDFIPSQTMYYDSVDDCFYMASANEGGEMIRISRTQPEVTIVSSPIESCMEYHDFVFDLYRSKDSKRYYLLIDKRIDPITHDYAIYSITTPFLDDQSIIAFRTPRVNTESSAGGHVKDYVTWVIVAVVTLLILSALLLWRMRRRRTTLHNKAVDADDKATILPEENPVVTPYSPQDEANVDTRDAALEGSDEEVSEQAHEEVHEDIHEDSRDEANEDVSEEEYLQLFNVPHGKRGESPRIFDRSRSAISLLGRFNVRDKEGNDITDRFTSKLKSLFILLLLSCQNDKAGIRYQVINEEIWDDKDEKSAQNNRNVTMRKLRILLEDVGNVVISYDKGYFKIDTGEVMFDYKELKKRMELIENGHPMSEELVNEILELLLMGPLLPKTTYEWLDKYKADFSDTALTILNKLLKYELGRDDELAYRIADTISLHDMLNEEALFAQCQILGKKKMMGLAKKLHTKFCREYKRTMGEEYSVGFAEIYKGDSQS